MLEIIDLSQEIYAGMPVHKSQPRVDIQVHATHEQWLGIENSPEKTPSTLLMSMSEHTGTHVDALSHMSIEQKGRSIDTMPLSMFYTLGLCLDFSHKDVRELITADEIKKALIHTGHSLHAGETLLFYTGHYQKYYGTPDWPDGPGLSADATRWLGNERIAAFGVETMAPGVSGVSNREVHQICGDMGFTHYENLINLDKLLGRGKFRFIALPLKIKGGTGSPVRAVAIFEN